MTADGHFHPGLTSKLEQSADYRGRGRGGGCFLSWSLNKQNPSGSRLPVHCYISQAKKKTEKKKTEKTEKKKKRLQKTILSFNLSWIMQQINHSAPLPNPACVHTLWDGGGEGW